MIGYDDLVHRVAVVDLDRDIIRVAGPDAIEYLQGQLSQEVAGLPVNDSNWSLLLQPQGKVDAWLRVTRVADDEVVLDVDRGWGEAVIARLSRFKLRTKADIEALPWSCSAIRGTVFSELQHADLKGLTVLKAPARWPLIGGVDLLGPDPQPPAELPLASLDAYEVRRIEAGLPRMGAELTEKTIPAEAGLVDASVSFTKGCYTGQELVARIDSRGGHVPRIIRSIVIGAGELPNRGDHIEIDGRDAGVLTSVARHPDGHAVALASVRRDVEPPAEGTCNGLAAAVRAVPPWQ
jgi:folate-binding protein YgfZ